MLIHQLSSTFWGTYGNFEDEKKNLDLMMKTIKDVYKKYTKVPMKKLDEILKHDLLWDLNLFGIWFDRRNNLKKKKKKKEKKCKKKI